MALLVLVAVVPPLLIFVVLPHGPSGGYKDPPLSWIWPPTPVGPLPLLKSLRRAEEDYKAKHHTYASINELHAEGLSPIREGEVDKESEFTFSSRHTRDRYTITAAPPEADMTTYTLGESGVILP